MNPKYLLFSLGLVACVGIAFGFRSANRTYLAASEGALTDVAPHPANPSRLLASSKTGVYVREENQSWRRIFSFSRHSGFIRHLLPHPVSRDRVFVVTEKEVLLGDLKSGRAQSLFREARYPRIRIHSLAIHPQDPDQIYLGTDQGLWISGDGGKTWLQSFRWPENQPVELIAFLPTNPPLFLLGTKREIFFSKDSGETYESGFSLPLFESGRDMQEENLEAVEAPFHTSNFTSLVFSSTDPSQIWIGTRDGVFESRDGGIVWQKLPDQGLENRHVQDLIYSERSGLIIATRRHVARFYPAKKRWEVLPIGLTQPPQALALNPVSKKEGEVLWVASGSEVLEWVLDPIEILNAPTLSLPSPERMALFKKLLMHEPTIREIQEAAIRYGELGNGKIRRWQWGSRLRAFIPRLSFGKSLSIGNNVDIDRGATNTRDEFILGPDDIDRGWDVGLTWELGDLFYSSAQTSIDSRAKLLVELRESILNQVTRIYFERRRFQMEIAFSPEISPQQYFDLLLRLDELTAQIDALTDGFLSQKSTGIYRDHPELREIYSMPPEDFHASNSNV